MSKLTKLVSTMAITTAVVLVACKSNNSEYEGYTKNENGLYYKLINHDEKGVTPKVGDGISISYKFTLTKNDSVILDSKKFSQDPSGKMDLPMFQSSFKGSLEDGILMLAKGDSASFILSADSFYLKTQRAKELPAFIKPGDKLTINVKLYDVKSKEQVQQERMAEMQQLAAQEKMKIDAYIVQNKITTQPTASGMYIVEKVKGKGKKIQKGDIAQVHYKGMFVDGKVFDSSEGREPLSLPAGGGQVIPGWDEAILTMTEGTKAQLIIPSNLAYGPQGMQSIPPFCPLVFEIEIVSVKSAPKEQVK